MGTGSRVANLFWAVVLVASLAVSAGAATVAGRTKYSKKSTAKVTENARTQKRIRNLRHSRTVAGSRTSRARVRRASYHRYYERFHTSSFADNQAAFDVKTGEDPVVRQAAIEALGDMNGTVVAVDPNSGRILAMVNQPLALSEGAQPCSTIKLSVALAALSEGIVTKDTKVSLGGGYRLNMTEAIAHSNNAYFEALGRKLGFERVAYYSHQFGLGELAGYHIQGEHLGTYPSEEIDAKLGGVGKMCSFGEGVSMTPLQLAALVSAIANGGTLYYLQHPRTPEEVANFQPMVKRHLDIGNQIPEILDGMAGAVRCNWPRWFRRSRMAEHCITCSIRARRKKSRTSSRW